MNTLEEKIGYLIAKVEEMQADQRTTAEKVDALEKRVEEKFKTAEVAFRIFKFLGMATAAILAFKFGDLPALWSKFF